MTLKLLWNIDLTYSLMYYNLFGVLYLFLNFYFMYINIEA